MTELCNKIVLTNSTRAAFDLFPKREMSIDASIFEQHEQ